jgi:hypothetical protein
VGGKRQAGADDFDGQLGEAGERLIDRRLRRKKMGGRKMVGSAGTSSFFCLLFSLRYFLFPNGF